jgi:hypothetical protein
MDTWARRDSAVQLGLTNTGGARPGGLLSLNLRVAVASGRTGGGHGRGAIEGGSGLVAAGAIRWLDPREVGDRPPPPLCAVIK